MNRTDRLLAILLALQANGTRRAADLAELFETSSRTIYRDMQALSEAGVPLVAIPGQGYSLMEGYFLPPLSFTADEATMLLLGSDVMAQSFDTHYRLAARLAGRKIASVLPVGLRAEVDELRTSIHFIPERATSPDDALARLRRAILERRTVSLRYQTRYRTDDDADEVTSRDVDPYTLVHMGGTWYLSGYDRLRDAARTFRLDRIDHFTILDRTFDRPLDAHRHGRPDQSARTLEIKALFAPPIVRWVREFRSFFATSEEETPDGLLVTFHVRQANEILAWLLSWGRHVRVLAPESLRQQIKDEARAMADAHADDQVDREQPAPTT